MPGGTESRPGRPKGPGRPAQINREQIVDAVFSGGNLDELTMRELASRLGVSHAALYRWISSRDELFDFVSEVMIDRVLIPTRPRGRAIRPWLTQVAWGIHDEFLAVPGFATRLTRPHRHSTHAFSRLREETIAAFVQTGAGDQLAEQSWYIFISSIVSWLAAHENPVELGESSPRFDLFLGVLLRGLPAREPGAQRRGACPEPGSTKGAGQPA